MRISSNKIKEHINTSNNDSSLVQIDEMLMEKKWKAYDSLRNKVISKRDDSICKKLIDNIGIKGKQIIGKDIGE